MSRNRMLLLTLGVLSLSAMLHGQTTEPAVPPPVEVKRRSDASDEDLRKELLRVSELGFNQAADSVVLNPLLNPTSITIRGKGSVPPPPVSSDHGPMQFKALTMMVKQPEQFSLPWRTGPDCSLGKEEAQRLHVLSLFLRECLQKSSPPKDVRPDPTRLKALLAADREKAAEFKTPPAIPTLMQLLQPENTPIRALLVELLADIKGKEASVALAQRALYDLSPDVREQAIKALAKRPAEEYQQVLLAGLRYPWPAAADHAAEAIAALGLRSLAPEMVAFLKEPAPEQPVKKGDKEYTVKELVRINHLSNCLLCHAPSAAKDDLVRGRVPVPGEDPPPLYYNASSGFFVRANTTYLRQDFSVVQPVDESGKWASNQRYDYLMRTRTLNAAEMKKFGELDKKKGAAEKYPQREAVLFALRETTKVNPGDTYEAWLSELPKLPLLIQSQPIPSLLDKKK